MYKRISEKLKSWHKMIAINRRSKLYSLISMILCLISMVIIVSCIALISIAIVALCSGEYTIDFTLRGVAYFFNFWESYRALISVLVGSITLCFAGYTLKQALDVATINSLTGLREKFNEQRKKSLHLFLMKDSEYPSDDKSDCNLAERITSDSNAKGGMINTDVSLDFNSADVLDYLGTIEMGNIMLKRGMISLKEFYNQFGYRLEYLLENPVISRHIYEDAKEYYNDLHEVIDRLKKYQLLNVSISKKNQNVYKYYSYKEHNIDAFRNNQLYFSRPSFLNDPFDVSKRLIEPFPKFCKEVCWSEELAERLDEHGICSFSEEEQPDNKHLWFLYADACKGYVLEYDRYTLEDGLAQRYRRPIYLQKVDYAFKPLDLDDFTLKFSVNGNEYSIKKCLEHKGTLERLFQYLHLYKDYNVWHLENESRLILGNLRESQYIKPHGNGYLLDLPTSTVKSLTIGDLMDESSKQRLITIAKGMGIPVFVATPEIKVGEWKISIQKLQ